MFFFVLHVKIMYLRVRNLIYKMLDLVSFRVYPSLEILFLSPAYLSFGDFWK